jgi:hypothetical protein
MALESLKLPEGLCNRRKPVLWFQTTALFNRPVIRATKAPETEMAPRIHRGAIYLPDKDQAIRTLQ